jgi:hypothetical protein
VQLLHERQAPRQRHDSLLVRSMTRQPRQC